MDSTVSHLEKTKINLGMADPTSLLDRACAIVTGEHKFNKLLLAAEYTLQKPEDSNQYGTTTSGQTGKTQSAGRAPCEAFLNSKLYQLAEICSHLSYAPYQDEAVIFKVPKPRKAEAIRAKKTPLKRPSNILKNTEKRKKAPPKSTKNRKPVADSTAAKLRIENTDEVQKEKEPQNIRRSHRCNKGAVYKSLVADGLLKHLTRGEQVESLRTSKKRTLEENTDQKPFWTVIKNTHHGKMTLKKVDAEDETVSKIRPMTL